MKNCNNCGTQNSDIAKFCRFCGTPFLKMRTQTNKATKSDSYKKSMLTTINNTLISVFRVMSKIVFLISVVMLLYSLWSHYNYNIKVSVISETECSAKITDSLFGGFIKGECHTIITNCNEEKNKQTGSKNIIVRLFSKDCEAKLKKLNGFETSTVLLAYKEYKDNAENSLLLFIVCGVVSAFVRFLIFTKKRNVK